MIKQQIENLFIFYFLYNGCERTCNLTNQSPDYLMEKWEKLIGIPGNKTKYPELFSNKLYQEWDKIWLKGRENPIPDNIMMFLIKTHPRENNGKYCHLTLINHYFETYIGKIHEIKQDKKQHLHPLLGTSITKILNIIVTTDEKREIILNNMLS